MSDSPELDYLNEFLQLHSQRILNRFREQEAQQEDQQLSMLARETRLVLEEKGVSFCYLDSSRVARHLLELSQKQESFGTVHFWYTRGHGVIVIRKPNRLYFIDLTGQKSLNLLPGITVLEKEDSHPIFGNEKVKQTITPPLELNDERVKGVAFPRGDEIPISSLEEIYDL